MGLSNATQRYSNTCSPAANNGKEQFFQEETIPLKAARVWTPSIEVSGCGEVKSLRGKWRVTGLLKRRGSKKAGGEGSSVVEISSVAFSSSLGLKALVVRKLDHMPNILISVNLASYSTGTPERRSCNWVRFPILPNRIYLWNLGVWFSNTWAGHLNFISLPKGFLFRISGRFWSVVLMKLLTL